MSTIRPAPVPGAITVRRALLSVSDKTGLVPFAQALHARGVTLLSTGGTAKALAEAGLPVVNVSDVTAFPEMLDGRVKTLHPAVHGGILARRHLPEDLAAIGAHGIEPIDLVVVNLYPFARAAANPATGFDALIEEIDIGGPSMVRAAAKNFRDVLIVVDPRDYPRVLEDLAAPGGSSPAFRFELSRRAFAHTAAYDATIASTLETIGTDADPFARPAERRRCRRRCACRCRSGACCATARTRTSRRRGTASSRRRGSAPSRSSRARSCPTPTCSTSTPPRASRSSSTSRRRRSSSTPTRAAWPPRRRSRRPTSPRATPTRCPPSAASSA